MSILKPIRIIDLFNFLRELSHLRLETSDQLLVNWNRSCTDRIVPCYSSDSSICRDVSHVIFEVQRSGLFPTVFLNSVLPYLSGLRVKKKSWMCNRTKSPARLNNNYCLNVFGCGVMLTTNLFLTSSVFLCLNSR